MIYLVALPPATSSRESQADWLELCVLQSSSKKISVREYIRDLGIGGTADAVDLSAEPSGIPIDEDDTYESIGDDTFAEINERFEACGGADGAYPFEIVGQNVLQMRADMATSAYVFMMLLSRFGKDAGPSRSKGAELFESLCAEAIRNYLGAVKSPGGQSIDTHSKSCVFGFPRRVLPSGFADAVDELCVELREGIGHRVRPKLPDQKDGKLDIVAWKTFPDLREGKLIAFAQCATGQDWNEKITELPDVDRWCSYWMQDSPAVLPIRAFCVPHRIEFKQWLQTAWYGGVLFDRCRIGYLSANIDESLSRKLARWSAYIIRRLER